MLRIQLVLVVKMNWYCVCNTLLKTFALGKVVRLVEPNTFIVLYYQI